MEAYFTNDCDFIPMSDQDLDQLLKGYGIDSSVKPQGESVTNDKNASLNNGLTQDNILEPFQYSSGTLGSNEPPKQTSAVISQTPATYTQNMSSSVTGGQLGNIQADFGIQTAKSNSNTSDNSMSDHDFEDLWKIIDDDQNGYDNTNGYQRTQNFVSSSVKDAQIPLTVHCINQNNILQQNSDVFTTINSVNIYGGHQVAANIGSSNFLSKQTSLSSPTPINEDKRKNLQANASNRNTTSPVAADEIKPFQKRTIIVNSNNQPKNAATEDPNAIHVTWQNNADLICQASSSNQQIQPSTQNNGSLKSKSKRTGIVGRCPQGVLPLYLQPEPENEEDKKKWRRAKIAHGHRVSKKNALINDSNTIKDLMKEMKELQNQLNSVTAERDSYKDMLNNLVGNGLRT